MTVKNSNVTAVRAKKMALFLLTDGIIFLINPLAWSAENNAERYIAQTAHGKP